MDNEILIGLITAIAAIMGSIISHVMLFRYEVRKMKIDRKLELYEDSIVVLERIKIGYRIEHESEEYLTLLKLLSRFNSEKGHRLLNIIRLGSNFNENKEEIVKTASELQSYISKELKE